MSLFTRDVSWKTSGKCGAPADLNICTELQLHCTTAAEVILVGNKKKNTQKRILQKVANVTTVWIFKDVYDGLPQTVCTSVAAEEEGTVKSVWRRSEKRSPERQWRVSLSEERHILRQRCEIGLRCGLLSTGDEDIPTEPLKNALQNRPLRVCPLLLPSIH